MNTKAILIAAAMMVASISLNAQETESTTFGLRAGIDFQNINGKNSNGNQLQNALVPRFNAGLNLEIPIAPDFFMQPGLLFTTKGANMKNLSPTTNINLSYIEMPISLMYKPMLGNGRLITGFGPYLAYGIGGSASRDNNGLNESLDVKYQNEVSITEIDPKTTYFRPLDYGVNIMGGYEFANRISMQLNTQLGLANLYPDHETDTDNNQTRWANTGFGLSLGYRF